jgi:hypothetical protein
MIFGNDLKIINKVENIIYSDFEYTNLGIAHYILRLGIKYSTQGILAQPEIIYQKILE